jgi:hypothetical protein
MWHQQVERREIVPGVDHAPSGLMRRQRPEALPIGNL